MKKILKNYSYLSMILGIIISLVSFITLFFVKERMYFTIVFVFNILYNFFATGFSLLMNDINTNKLKFSSISLYLLITLFFLLMDVVVISNVWDLNIYSNLMYLTNIKLYLAIYSVFVLIMILMSIYVVIKSYRKIESKNTVRQQTTKQ